MSINYVHIYSTVHICHGVTTEEVIGLSKMPSFFIQEADNWTTLSADVDEVFDSGDINAVSIFSKSTKRLEKMSFHGLHIISTYVLNDFQLEDICGKYILDIHPPDVSEETLSYKYFFNNINFIQISEKLVGMQQSLVSLHFLHVKGSDKSRASLVKVTRWKQQC